MRMKAPPTTATGMMGSKVQFAPNKSPTLGVDGSDDEVGTLVHSIPFIITVSVSVSVSVSVTSEKTTLTPGGMEHDWTSATVETTVFVDTCVDTETVSETTVSLTTCVCVTTCVDISVAVTFIV